MNEKPYWKVGVSVIKNTIFFVLFFQLFTSLSYAESIRLSLNVIKKPASDLVFPDGQMLDSGEAAARAKQGEDLSQYNPLNNKLWQNQKYSSSNSEELEYPQGPIGVDYLTEEAAVPFTYMVKVQSRQNPNKYFRFALSRNTHSALMRAALLRKLGYYVPSPKFYKNLKIFFKNEKEKELFLENAQASLISDFESRNWIVENNQQLHYVVFSDAVLESLTNEYFDVYWGFAPSPKIPSQLATVQRFSRYRAFRALILPYVLVDVPESVNRFEPKLSGISDGKVNKSTVFLNTINLYHPYAESFSACTYEDGLWLMRKIAQLNEKDIREIVQAGQFGCGLDELVYRKLLYRISHAKELFALGRTANLPPLEINTNDGFIQKGKVMKEYCQGYPQRVSHGDRETPIEDGDYKPYLSIRGKSSAIGTAIIEINKKLQLLTTESLFKNRQQEIMNRLIDHVKNNPLEPLYQKVEVWGGPIAGFNLSAARHITTGTYYESSAAIQLVDNLSISANLGYFAAVDGIAKTTPLMGANVVVLRDYTHVRPLMSMKESKKVEWKNLVVPKFMKNLATILKKADPVVLSEEEKAKLSAEEREKLNNKEPEKLPLDEFLNELRDGEVFTITDSIAGSAYAQVGSSWDVLMGISPLGFLNNINVGFDASRTILRQTSISKTSNGVQIFLRNQKNKILGLTIDTNYFLNIMKIRSQTREDELKDRAYVIQYDPGMVDNIDLSSEAKYVQEFKETRTHLKRALYALFVHNNSELLEEYFQYKEFKVDHNLNTKEQKSKMLLWRMTQFEEDHLLQITYPKNKDYPELKPEDEKVVIFQSKKGELKGRDLLGGITDLLQGLLNKWIPKHKIDLNDSPNPNPANTPYGKAYWRMVTSDTDISPNIEQYPNVSIIQHVWGGWDMKGKDFRQLISQISDKYNGTGLSPYRLIEDEQFYMLKSIDFFRITANFSVLPGGLDKIRDLITQPEVADTPAKKAKFIGRLFQKLSEKFGQKSRAGDKAMYEAMITLLGNGNYQKGAMLYQEQCQQLANKQQNDDAALVRSSWLNGTAYDCLMPWMTKLIKLAGQYPQSKKDQTHWMTQVLYVLDETIPQPVLMKYLGKENYIFSININGFRTGDEDGDLAVFSNTLGEPAKEVEYAGGLVQLYSGKTGIAPVELDRSNVGVK